ncbi:alpha-tocopherol transfer protein-like [Anoplophora glabripennis]|uniref:alpha-tocopherol transfer protein-like n=1 Tax=Anoplophora glabripennis TaxID=217634 RepID=UPI000874C2A8|nr:alpha-tocopherol transfer protein-like [Anoplophora glabripennis]XP_018571185.1 alpha-tocopherol transfer protein-like [Anoplophora glabripennis]XP_018571186.1 alpha-tocopherol transfer protein-like [Anoplophora glabripennis]XP_018571187.1 alpha-tocopherol transfer protein-like [Anoplophora glabripennis]
MKLEFQWTPEQIISEGRTTRENLETIRTWLSNLNDKNIPLNVQDEMIVLFLLSCCNDIQLTKNTVLAYYKCKKEGPEIYDDRNLERTDIKLALNTIHMSSIPVRTEENYVVHYFRVNDANYNNFDLVPIMKISYMLMDISQAKNPPSGLIVVIDMKGLGLMHLTKMKLGAIKKYLQFLQEGFPMQLKVIHLLNAVYFMDKIMALIKVFMKSELIDMLKIHAPGLEQEKLFQMVPKMCLPKECGGDLPSEVELHERTLRQFKEMQSFWNMEEAIRKQCK